MRREAGGRGAVPGVQMFVRLVVARGVARGELLLLLRLPEGHAHIRQRGAAHVAAQTQPHGRVAPVVVRGRQVRHRVSVLLEFVRLCGVLGVAVFRGEGAPRGDEGRHQHLGATVVVVVVVVREQNRIHTGWCRGRDGMMLLTDVGPSIGPFIPSSPSI